MDTKKPLRKDGILTRRIGDEWMLYDSEKGDIHVINSTAEFVWRSCDGSRSISEIQRQVKETFDVPNGIDIIKDIDGIIEKFYDLGVLS
jgi:hypothetical protein